MLPPTPARRQPPARTANTSSPLSIPGSTTSPSSPQASRRCSGPGWKFRSGRSPAKIFRLPIGQSTTTIEVTGQPPLLNSDNATVGQVITNRQIVNLPLNGRGFYQLAQLTPGAALLPPTGNSVAIRPESIDGNTISGIRGSALSFLLDGVDVSEQHQGGTFIQTSIDALQEFSVEQNPYSAEFNRGGGFFNCHHQVRQQSVPWRSLRIPSQRRAGCPQFLRHPQRAAQAQPVRRHARRAALRSPSCTAAKIALSSSAATKGSVCGRASSRIAWCRRAAERNGDFSAAGLNKIYDPLTTTGGATPTRTQFAGNIIPQDRLSSQALYLNKYIPLAEHQLRHLFLQSFAGNRS